MSDIPEEEIARAIALELAAFRRRMFPDSKVDLLPSEMAQATGIMIAVVQPALERVRREERDHTMAVLGRNMALRSALRVNGLRSGATHADVDAVLAEIDRAHPNPPSRSPEQHE